MDFELVNAIDLQDCPYIFDISLNIEKSNAALSLSSNDLSIRDLESLQQIQLIHHHADTITTVQFLKASSHLVHTAAMDKMLCIWDIRSPGIPSFIISAQDEVTASAIGIDDTLLAAGVGSEIYFYDIRSCGRPLGVYSDCHTDSVSRLRFHPTSPAVLLSGAEDGLLCTFNTAAAAQDEAVLSIMNTECAVRETGFFASPGGGGAQMQGQQHATEGLYCLSTVETASFWHYPSAQRVGHFPRLRDGIGADYLVSCWHEEESAAGGGGVFMLAGCNSGSGMVCEVSPSSVRPVGSLACGASLQGTAQAGDSLNGHNDIIRCAATVLLADRFIVSGGEDGRLCVWKDRDSGMRSEGVSPLSQPHSSSIGSGSTGSHSRGGAALSQRKKSKNIRYCPI